MSDGRFEVDGRWTQCALGKEGVIPAADKREGDNCSPLGVWPIRRVLYRPDGVFAALPVLKTLPVPVEAIGPRDGWCDAPGDRNYNRPVKLPYASSAERMWRDDHLYDLVVVLGHNDDPVVPLMGSAIFLHLARPNYAGTEGCVALERGDMIDVLRKITPGSAVSIVDAYPHPEMAVSRATATPRLGPRLGPRAKQR